MEPRDIDGVELGEPVRTQPCHLQELPIELVDSVLEGLDLDGKKALSKCSRFWYHLIFPLRIRGLRFGSDLWERDELSKVLQNFDEGHCFAPLRRHIRSLTLENRSIGNLPHLLSQLSMFTEITAIVVRTEKSCSIQRNLYVAIFSHLQALPYYDSVQHIAVEWDGESICSGCPTPPEFRENSDFLPDPEELDLMNASDVEISDPDKPYPRLEPYEERRDERRAYLTHRGRSLLQGESFLDPYVSERAFAKLVKRIRFPRNLVYLKLDIEGLEPAFGFPLIHSKIVTALHIRTWSPRPIVDPAYPDQILEFPTIEALALPALDISYGNPATFDYIPLQFPNLTSLVLVEIEVVFSRWLFGLPNFPKLEYLDVPWSWSRDNDPGMIATIEKDLRKRLQAGYFPALRKMRSSGSRLRPNDFRFSFGEATCLISRAEGPGTSESRLKIEWVEDLHDVLAPEKTYLDKRWSFENLIRRTGQVCGEIEGNKTDKMQVEIDESVYESEEERIEMDRRLKLREAWRTRRSNKRKEEKRPDGPDASGTTSTKKDENEISLEFSEISFEFE